MRVWAEYSREANKSRDGVFSGMYICVYMYKCACVRIYICLNILIYKYLCDTHPSYMYVHSYVCMYVYITYSHLHVYVCTLTVIKRGLYRTLGPQNHMKQSMAAVRIARSSRFSKILHTSSYMYIYVYTHIHTVYMSMYTYNSYTYTYSIYICILYIYICICMTSEPRSNILFCPPSTSGVPSSRTTSAPWRPAGRRCAGPGPGGWSARRSPGRA